jgi:hypothetical protein
MGENFSAGCEEASRWRLFFLKTAIERRMCRQGPGVSIETPGPLWDV